MFDSFTTYRYMSWKKNYLAKQIWSLCPIKIYSLINKYKKYIKITSFIQMNLNVYSHQQDKSLTPLHNRGTYHSNKNHETKWSSKQAFLFCYTFINCTFCSVSQANLSIAKSKSKKYIKSHGMLTSKNIPNS